MASTQQTQQNNIVEIDFEPGSTAVYAAGSASILQFTFDEANVVFDQQGGDLRITNLAGDSVVIENYVDMAHAGTAPQVMLDDGVMVSGDVFLFSVGHEDTAAGTMAAGSGLNGYSADAGSLFGGLDHQALLASEDHSGQQHAAGHGSISSQFDAHDDFSGLTLAGADLGGGDGPNPGGDTPDPGGETPGPGGDVPGPGGDVPDPGGDVPAYVYPDIAENTHHEIPAPYSAGHNLIFNPQSDFTVPDGDSADWYVPAASGVDSHIETGVGNDFIIGNTANDSLYGHAGDDIISGWGGDDLLNGGAGNDILEGGYGNDTIYGGNGYDTITLGEGHDVLVFDNSTFSGGPAIVTVNDYTVGEDGIQLDDDVKIEAMRDYGTYTEAVLTNDSDDHVIVRLLGTNESDLQSHVDSLGDSHAYNDTEQLLQYLAGNENAWV